MVSAERLLRLYPRAWRERYAEEFLAMLGPKRLQLQQVVDIVSGAVDAWLSSDVRGATPVAGATGRTHIVRTLLICKHHEQRYTKRDGLIGAAVMIAGAVVFSGAGIAMKRSGWIDAGEMLVNFGSTAPIVLSMPFWLMKHQPWRAQAVIVGGTLTLLAAVSWLATAI